MHLAFKYPVKSKNYLTRVFTYFPPLRKGVPLRSDRNEARLTINLRPPLRRGRRGNKSHRSVTDPDCRFVSKGSGTGAYPGYTVNAMMENRNRILLGGGVEIFRNTRS